MKNIIAGASGKGGVGKSTVAANLAVMLANHNFPDRKPLNIALVDVDFYGPSIPTIMGGGDIYSDANKKIVPPCHYGVKYISIGFFLKNLDDPIIWRGPRFGRAMEQLFNDVSWGDVDICIVDMPPGTGDSQISLSQVVRLTGALVVTTPQEVALMDVRRAIKMFEQVNVPVLGLVENMAGYKLPGGEIIDIFGAGGGKSLSTRYDIPLFGSIPIDVSIREGGDKGQPVVIDKDSDVTAIYNQIANSLLLSIDQINSKETSISVEN